MNLLQLQKPNERTLGRLLLAQAEAVPKLPAVMTADSACTYGQLNERANAYAAGFAALGVKRGDTVSLFLESCIEFVFAVYGLSKLGAVWVPVDTACRGEGLREIFENSCSSVLVSSRRQLPRIRELSSLPFKTVIVRELAAGESLAGTRTEDMAILENGESTERYDSRIHCGDTSAVTWTSGTTGKSKGVMVNHNNWLLAAESASRYCGFRPGDAVYNCLPLCNAGAWTANIFLAHHAGLPVAIDPEFSASEFWQRIRHFGATHTLAIGSMALFIWQQPQRPDDRDNPLRSATLVALPENLVEPFQKRFDIQQIINHGYGQSEAQAALSWPADGSRGKPNCLGQPVPSVEVGILDSEDQPVPSGEVGELCLRPKVPYAIFNGYFNNPGATLRAFRNLWYHTGDLVQRDEDGEYFFVDRKADFIRYKGRNTSSFEIEAVLRKHEAVADVAVFGIPREDLPAEAEIMAAIILTPGAQAAPEELARFVNERAPYFHVPRYIEFLKEFPLTPNSKVQKYKLRERGVGENTWDRDAAGFKLIR